MAKNNKTRFFYVLYSDKTWVFDQSEPPHYPIYIIKWNKYHPPFTRTIKFHRSMKAFCQAQNYLFSIALLLLFHDLPKQTESFEGEKKLLIVSSSQAT